MFRTIFLLLITPAVLTTQYALGVSLPTGLSTDDISEVVSTLGPGSATRSLRSADAYASFPGVKFGMELALLPTGNLNRLGDANGSLPALQPLPRFYLAKGLFSDAELVISFFPSGIVKGVSVFGTMLKWTYLKEWEAPVSLAFFIGYTYIDAFKGGFTGSDVELGATVSRDLIFVKPYFGIGGLFARGTVESSSSVFKIHTFAGVEYESIVNLSAQFDLMNLLPSATFFVGKRF